MNHSPSLDVLREQYGTQLGHENERLRQRAEAAERDNAQLAERLARAEGEVATLRNARSALFLERDAARAALRWIERLLPEAEPSNPIRDKILSVLGRES